MSKLDRFNIGGGGSADKTRGGALNLKAKKNQENIKDFNDIIRNSQSDKVVSQEYTPFRDNDVLTVENTNDSILILLRNGNLLSWGEANPTLGRRHNDSNDTLKPGLLKFKKKIVDISCGRDHCIAKSEEFKVYTWGNNSHGQLGLCSFPMNAGSSKEEPTEINTFSNQKVRQIKAGPMTSYAVVDGNFVYGWGCNEFGQLFIENDSKKIPTPTLIEPNDKFTQEFHITMDKKGKKTYLMESK